MRGLLVAALGVAAPSLGWAGAWPQPPGETLAIVKYERGESQAVLDEFGLPVIAAERSDENISVYLDHGYNDNLTLHALLATGADRQALVSNGKGQFEFGLRYGMQYRATAISAYASAAMVDDARFGWMSDYEFTMLAGRSGNIMRRPVFVEVRLSRVLRSNLPNQVRADLTLGLTPRPGLQLLAQAYSGRTDAGPGQWLKLETSMVATHGSSSFQLGWRQTVIGRGIASEAGPVLALWRRF